MNMTSSQIMVNYKEEKNCGGIETVAHLIKLEDYISRYQFDLYRYPNQFTRLKKERWEYFKIQWQEAKDFSSPLLLFDKEDEEEEVVEEKNLVKRTIAKVKGWYKFKHDPIFFTEEEPKNNQFKHIQTIEQLRRMFLDEMFESQIRWASSSLLERSHVSPHYRHDHWLRFFVQKLPDNYLVMYEPIFFIKQAPVEMGTIIISPTEIYCITLIEGKETSVFDATADRFWIEHVGEKQHKVLSPVVALNRSASILREILIEAKLRLPVKKVVLAPDTFIDIRAQGLRVDFIDKRYFNEWHEKLVKHPSPLKRDQLKVAKELLEQCKTVAHRRQQLVEVEELEQED